MSTITLFYCRTGPWPATDPAMFEIASENPAPKHRVIEHGSYDVEPSMRGQWTALSLPDDATAGVRHLRMVLGLEGPLSADRSAVLMADSISLLRSVALHLGWPITVDPTAWLNALPEEAHIQRAMLTKACS